MFSYYRLNWKKEIFQTPGAEEKTGGRLFASMMKELNYGLPRNNSSLVVRVELEPVTSRSSLVP